MAVSVDVSATNSPRALWNSAMAPNRPTLQDEPGSLRWSRSRLRVMREVIGKAATKGATSGAATVDACERLQSHRDMIASETADRYGHGSNTRCWCASLWCCRLQAMAQPMTVVAELKLSQRRRRASVRATLTTSAGASCLLVDLGHSRSRAVSPRRGVLCAMKPWASRTTRPTRDILLLSRDAKQPAGPQTVTGSERLRPCQVLDSKGPDRNGTQRTQIFTDFSGRCLQDPQPSLSTHDAGASAEKLERHLLALIMLWAALEAESVRRATRGHRPRAHRRSAFPAVAEAGATG